jgi:hypothetical protein
VPEGQLHRYREDASSESRAPFRRERRDFSYPCLKEAAGFYKHVLDETWLICVCTNHNHGYERGHVRISEEEFIQRKRKFDTFVIKFLIQPRIMIFGDEFEITRIS